MVAPASYRTVAVRPVGGLMYASDDMASTALPVVVMPASAGTDLPPFLMAPTVSAKVYCGLNARSIAARCTAWSRHSGSRPRSSPID